MHLAHDIGSQLADLPRTKALAEQVDRRNAIVAENAQRAARGRGVSFGGLTAPLLPVPTARDMVAAATASAERAAAYAATSDGQTMAAIGECERMVRAIHAQLDRVRSARSRADGSLTQAASEFTAMVRSLLPEALTLDLAAHAVGGE